MKNQSHRERYCAICGKPIITHDPQSYVYKRRDYRAGSETFHKTLFFCSNGCMNSFEKVYPARKRIVRNG